MMEGSRICAACWVIAARPTSVPTTRRLALRPAAQPAKPAAMPASGLRPNPLKIMAPRGGTTTKAALEAMLPITPQKAMIAVTILLGALRMVPRRTAESRPTSSATPSPIIITSTRPSGLKSTKFFTQFLSSQIRPSAETRLCTTSVLPLGSTMLTPWKSQERRITIKVSTTKMVTGWGNLFPARSIRPRMPERFSIFSFAMSGNSLRLERGMGQEITSFRFENASGIGRAGLISGGGESQVRSQESRAGCVNQDQRCQRPRGQPAAVARRRVCRSRSWSWPVRREACP